jgi:hypothetical protein
MSDERPKPKIVGVHIHFEPCERSPEHVHVTNVEPVHDVDVVYDAPDADDVLTASTLGWTRAYAKNWDATFGPKPEPELN